MNNTDRGILYGMVLGDGGIYTIKDQSLLTARLVMGHSPKQRAYLEYKNQLLHSIFGGKLSKINEYSSFNKKVQKEYTNIQVCRTEKYFRQMKNTLYEFGQKKFTRQVLDYVSDHGLALWYMDDGSGTVCKNKQGKVCGCMSRIATYCSIGEAEIIKNWFLDTYDIEIKFDLDKRNNKVSIRMNTSESKKFVQIVSPYIHESMLYKIQHVGHNDTRVLSSTTVDEDIV